MAGDLGEVSDVWAGVRGLLGACHADRAKYAGVQGRSCQYSSTIAGRSVSSRCCPFASADSLAFTTKSRRVWCLAVVGLGAGRRCVSVVAATPVRHLSWVVDMAQGQGADGWPTSAHESTLRLD
jgi:hypothetical protein